MYLFFVSHEWVRKHGKKCLTWSWDWRLDGNWNRSCCGSGKCRIRSNWLGVGALVGAGLGLAAHEDKENKEAVLKALRGKRKEVIQEPPMLKAAEASCYKVDEKVEGEEYFGPQLRCRIEKNAVWGLK